MKNYLKSDQLCEPRLEPTPSESLPGVFSMLSLNDYAVYSLAGSKSTYEDLNVRQRYISEEKNADVNSILPHGLSFTWVLRGLVPVGCF